MSATPSESISELGCWRAADALELVPAARPLRRRLTAREEAPWRGIGCARSRYAIRSPKAAVTPDLLDLESRKWQDDSGWELVARNTDWHQVVVLDVTGQYAPTHHYRPLPTPRLVSRESTPMPL